MAGSLEKKVAIVTGGAGGIGLATGKRLASMGAFVLLADRNADALARASKGVSDAVTGATVATSPCDVSKAADVDATVQLALDRFGSLDVVVNNAGVMIFKPLDQHTEQDWSRVLSVDLLGAFFFIKRAFDVMKHGGAIVNVASVHAVETTPLVAAYAAAKAAVVSLTRTASIEGQKRGIRVNAVLPGAVDTPMLWENPNIKSGLETIHKTDVGKPDDIAAVIAFLASPESAFVKGASVLVDGGRLSHL